MFGGNDLARCWWQLAVHNEDGFESIEVEMFIRNGRIDKICFQFSFEILIVQWIRIILYICYIYVIYVVKIIRSVVAKGNPIDPAIHSMAEWRPKMSRKVADDLAAFHQNVRAGPIRADPLGTRGATWCIAGDQTWWFQAYIYIYFICSSWAFDAHFLHVCLF